MKEELHATKEQIEGQKRFERERSERVRQVEIEWQTKQKLKKEGKQKTKSK